MDLDNHYIYCISEVDFYNTLHVVKIINVLFVSVNTIIAYLICKEL